MSITSFFHRIKSKGKDLRQHQKNMNTLEQTAILFETLNKFKSAGLLFYDFRHNIVTIAQALAEHFIYSDKEWQRFLHQCHLWAAYQYSINEYTKMYSKVQADAEASAYAAKRLSVRGSSSDIALTDSERRLARMQAVAKLDSETAEHRALPMPDVQFLVLGALDGKPMIVARLINGIYETSSVPDDSDNDEED